MKNRDVFSAILSLRNTFSRWFFPFVTIPAFCFLSAQASPVSAAEDHFLFNPYNVLEFSIRTEHNEQACPFHHSSAHVFNTCLVWIDNVKLSEELGCMPDQFHSEDILSQTITQFHIPLDPCLNFHPDIEIDYDNYSVFLSFNIDRDVLNHQKSSRSNLTTPKDQTVDVIEYNPWLDNSLKWHPLRHFLEGGVTLELACEKIHISARPACNISIEQTGISYVGHPYAYKFSAKTECDGTEYLYTDPFFQWEYAHSGTNGFQEFPFHGKNITASLSNIPEATFHDNIIVRLKNGEPTNSLNSKVIRFYPQIPQPIRVSNTNIPVGQDRLSRLEIQFDRNFSQHTREKIQLITIYDKIGSSPNGNLNINEARIVYQQAVDISEFQIAQQIDLYLPSTHWLSPGEYYLTVEGSSNGFSNHPLKNDNGTLPSDLQTAIFKCLKFKVYSNEIELESVEYTPPLCFGEDGSIQVKIGRAYFPHEFLPEFYSVSPSGEEEKVSFTCISRGSFQNPVSVFEYHQVNENRKNFLIKEYTQDLTGGTGNLLTRQTRFDVETQTQEKIVIPILKKDLSGKYYINGVPSDSKDAYIVVDRDGISHAAEPYQITYSAQHISPYLQNPLQNDTLPCPQGGQFRIYVKDRNGCIQDTLVQIKNLNKEIEVGIKTTEMIHCHGGNNGCLQAEILRKPGDNLSFRWFRNGEKTDLRNSSFNYVDAGIYTVELSDHETGMKSSSTITLSDPLPLHIQVHNIGHVKCHGEENGYINLTAKGGTPPYTFAWNDGFIGESRTKLPAGEYTLNLMDNHGCSVSRTFRIDQPEKPFSIQIDSIVPSHYNVEGKLIKGQVFVSQHGGTQPYGNLICCQGHDLQQLEPGIHQLVGIDYLGCYDSKVFHITHHDSMEIEILQTREILCHGESTACCKVEIKGGVPPFRILWNTGHVSESIENLGPGEYWVEVTDNIGKKLRKKILLSQPAPLSVDSSHVKQPSYAYYKEGILQTVANNGEIHLFVSGGTPPYSCQWLKNGSSFATKEPLHLRNLNPGIYVAIIEDSHGCQIQSNFYLQDIEPLKAEAEILKPILCHGHKEGFLLGRVSGGVPPYRFVWKNKDSIYEGIYLGQDSCCVEQIPAGEYTLTATDANLVQSTSSVILGSPPELKTEISSYKHPSYGGSIDGILPELSYDGQIHLHPEGGTPPYQISWFRNHQPLSQNDTVLSEIGEGLYHAIVSDGNHCQDTMPAIELFRTTDLFSYVRIMDSVSCSGFKDASLQAEIRGGKPPYFTQWIALRKNGETPPATGHSYDTLSVRNEHRPDTGFFRWDGTGAAHYHLRVSDSKGINSSFYLSVSEPDSLEAHLSGEPSLCSGDSSGYVTATVKGGNTPYSFIWNVNQEIMESDSPQIGNLENAQIELKVYDRKGCTSKAQYILQSPDSLVLSVAQTGPSYDGYQYQVSPENISDGKIHVNIRGGVPPYTSTVTSSHYFQQRKDSRSFFYDSLPEGSFHILITDSHSCQKETEIVLTRTPHLHATLEAIQHPLCHDSASGILQLQVLGGEKPYHIQWYKGKNWIAKDTILLSNLEPGTYTVEVTDNNGIRSTDSITLHNPLPLSVFPKTIHASAWTIPNGSIEVSIHGGTSPYSILWHEHPEHQGFSLDSLERGCYDFTVYDHNGCHSVHHTRIESPDSLYIDNEIIGHIDFKHPHGSINFHIQGGRPPFFIKAYSDSTIHLEECTISGSARNASLSGTLAEKGSERIFMDTVNERKISLKGLPKGILEIHIQDSGSAQAIYHGEILRIKQIVTQLWVEKELSCHNTHDACLSAWTQGGLPPYSLKWERYSYTKNMFEEILSNQDNICEIGSGLYRFTASDNLGHYHSDSIIIQAPDPLHPIFNINEANPSSGSLAHGKLTVLPSGGTSPYQYLWNTGETTPTIDFCRDSSYTLILTDAHGCQTITNPDTAISQAMKVKMTLLQNIECHGDSSGKISLSIQWGKPPFGITWLAENHILETTEEFQLQDLPSGKYHVYVKDLLGNLVHDSILISEPEALINSFKIKDASCFGSDNAEIIVMTSGGNHGYSYLWENGSTSNQRKDIPAGNYYLTTTDGKGCIRKDTLQVRQPDILQANIICEQPLCYNSSGYISAKASGGTRPYLFQWSFTEDSIPAPSENPPTPIYHDSILGYVDEGWYHLRLTDQQGCLSDTSLHIIRPDSLKYTLERERYLCLGQDIPLQVSVPEETTDVSFQWFTPWGEEKNSSVISVSQTGLYQILLTEKGECLYKDSVLVKGVPDSIHAEFWVSSHIQTQQNFLLVNLSLHKPDSIGWILPPEAEVVADYGNALEICLEEEGIFELGCISYKGFCREECRKEVKVSSLPRDGMSDFTKRNLEIHVFPNPNHTECFINIKTGTSLPSQDRNLEYAIISSPQGKLVEKGNIPLSPQQILSYPILKKDLLPGIYILLTRYHNSQQSFKIIRY